MAHDDDGDGAAASAASAPHSPPPAPQPSSSTNQTTAASSDTPSSEKKSTRNTDTGTKPSSWLLRTLVKQGKSSLQNIAKNNPLLAAIAAPTSTLLDIPALIVSPEQPMHANHSQQPWYIRDGETIPDRRACVALSSTSLGLNILAMFLLLLRFSSSKGVWQRAADLSVVFWLLKTVVALCNLFIFGAVIPRPPGSEFSEGFWCAVMSVIIAGSITFALFLHYLLCLITPLSAETGQDLRLTGRKFLVSVTAFTILIGLEALAFSQLESWRYLDAIYFSIQTALTVGYGDITPDTAAGKILTFIFAALTLCQLGNIVSLTIDWVQSRAVERRQKWLKKYSAAIHRSALKRKPHATLIDEIALLHQINLHQES